MLCILIKKNMKHLLKSSSSFVHAFVLLLATTYSFGQTTGDEILGTWLNQEKEAQIEITKTGETYSGKIVWLKLPNDPETGKARLDKFNPDSKLRSRPILGSELLYGFIFDNNEKEWNEGTIYDGRESKSYKCYMSLNPDGSLKVRGYVGLSWMGLGKTNIWTRKTN